MDSHEETHGGSDLAEILLLSAAMFLGAFVSGLVPLKATLSLSSLRLLNVFGCGLMLGTALAVIIPEGVHSLYHAHAATARAVSNELVVGVALVSGFLTMLFVDAGPCFADGMHAHSHLSSDDHGDPDLEEPDKATDERKSNTATTGLVVHSAADGLALGVVKASGTATSSLQVVVFAAIMLHKMPAAFALSAYLRSVKVSGSSRTKSLVVFSAAAPVCAVVSFLLLHPDYLGLTSANELLVSFCLLFSAGTFLYVAAVHSLGELVMGRTSSGSSSGGLDAATLVVLTVGCFFPLLLSMGHSHEEAHAHEH